VLDDVVEELKSWLMGFELLVVVMDLEMMLPVLLSRGGDVISSLDRMLLTARIETKLPLMETL